MVKELMYCGEHQENKIVLAADNDVEKLIATGLYKHVEKEVVKIEKKKERAVLIK